MNTHKPNALVPFRLFLFYAAFPVVGIALAYWLGLGWLFLLIALRVAASDLAGPRRGVLRLLYGQEIATEVDKSLHEERRSTIRARLAVPVVVLYVAVAAVVFWKFNAPLQEVIAMILRVP